MKDQTKQDMLFRFFAVSIRQLMAAAHISLEQQQEIRMRTGRPILFYDGKREYTITDQGNAVYDAGCGHIVSAQELSATLESISGYSLYAFDEEMRKGFLTVQGGHRIGLAGKIIMDGNKISCIRDISYLNIRLSHEKIGCADPIVRFLIQGDRIYHTLIISPPGVGKTTLLRDIIRQISDGVDGCSGHTVGVVDERSELAGSWKGIPQNNLGMRTDVLDCCPKAEGMLMLLRSMAPQVIAVDELGGSDDSYAIENVFRCGCRLIATVHGSSVADVYQKKQFHALVKEQMFERYVVLGKHGASGRRIEVFDADQKLLFREEMGSEHADGS